MEGEKDWNYDDRNVFNKTLEDIGLNFSRLFTNWSINRNARVFTISGRQAAFDYVMQDLTSPSHIITVKIMDTVCDCLDPFIDFILDSMDAVAWRYIIIVPDEMERSKMEFCEIHGAIVYSLNQLLKISEIGRIRTSVKNGKCREFPTSIMN